MDFSLFPLQTLYFTTFYIFVFFPGKIFYSRQVSSLLFSNQDTNSQTIKTTILPKTSVPININLYMSYPGERQTFLLYPDEHHTNSCFCFIRVKLSQTSCFLFYSGEQNPAPGVIQRVICNPCLTIIPAAIFNKFG